MNDNVYLAEIRFPYEDYYTTIGIFSTQEKADAGIKVRLLTYQQLTNRSDEDIKHISTNTLRFTLDWIDN